LASATLSNLELSLPWLEVFSLVLVVLALLLLLKIILLRLKLIRRTRRGKQIESVCQPLLAATIAGESVSLPGLPKGDEIFALNLWNHLQESLRGVAGERLNALANRCGLTPYVYGLLRKKDLRSRLIALKTLGHLGDRMMWDEIQALTRSPDPQLSLVAVRTLYQIDPDTALIETVTQLIEREDWSVAQLMILIEEVAARSTFILLTDAASRLAASTDPASLVKLRRLLRLLEVAPSHRVLPTVRAILAATEDDEVVAQCLKFLNEPDDLPLVRKYLTHPNWVIRLQAVRMIGRIGLKEDEPRLRALLHDSVWWVRYRSAEALVSVTHGNIQALSRLKEGMKDRYARDMLEMVMTEQGVR
jgi:HEAT repeat protein